MPRLQDIVLDNSSAAENSNAEVI